MKTRVTAIVTLLTLILLGVLLIQSCSVLAEKENSDYQDGIRFVCQASSATLADQSTESRIELLRALAHEDKDISIGLYNADGSLAHASDRNMLPLTEDDLLVAQTGSVKVYNRNNTEGKEAIYAIYQFEDGAFLLLSRELTTG